MHTFLYFILFPFCIKYKKIYIHLTSYSLRQTFAELIQVQSMRDIADVNGDVILESTPPNVTN